MKRSRLIVTLGLLALLLTTTVAFSPAPASETQAPGIGTTSHHPNHAFSDAYQGLVVQNPNPSASNHSRVYSYAPQGIFTKAFVPPIPAAHAWSIGTVLPIFATGFGFHAQLRAPPAFLLS